MSEYSSNKKLLIEARVQLEDLQKQVEHLGWVESSRELKELKERAEKNGALQEVANRALAEKEALDDGFEDEDATVIPDGFAPTSTVVDSLSDATGVLVVDVSNLAYRSAFAYADLRTSSGAPSGHVFGSVRLLLATVRNHLPPGRWCFVFCYDGTDAKARRQAVLPSYKANRSADRFNPLPEVNKVVGMLPGIHVSHHDCEGDDAVAWAARRMGTPTRQVVILSGDKDLWALLAVPHVKVFSPNLKRYVGPADIEKNYLTTDPARIPFAKALFGDDSDGIKGVKGLLKAYTVHHLNIPDFGPEAFFDSVCAAPSCPEHLTEDKACVDKKQYSKKKDESTRAKIKENRGTILTNLEVIEAYTEPFGRDCVKMNKISPERRTCVAVALNSYECTSLVNRIDDLFGAEFYVESTTEED